MELHARDLKQTPQKSGRPVMPPPGFTAPLTAISKSGLGNDISNGSPHCNPSRTSSQDAPAQPHHPPASIRADREWAQHSREVRRDALAAYRPPHTPLLAASALAASTSPSPSPLLAPFHLTQLRCAAACMLAGVRAGPAGVHSADAAHLAAQLQAGDPGSWWELCLGAGEQGWRGPGPTPPTATHSPAPTVHGMEDAGPGSAMDRRVQFAQSAGDAAITVSEAAVAALADGGALRVLGAPEGQVVLVLDADLLRQAALEAADVSCLPWVDAHVHPHPHAQHPKALRPKARTEGPAAAVVEAGPAALLQDDCVAQGCHLGGAAPPQLPDAVPSTHEVAGAPDALTDEGEIDARGRRGSGPEAVGVDDPGRAGGGDTGPHFPPSTPSPTVPITAPPAPTPHSSSDPTAIVISSSSSGSAYTPTEAVGGSSTVLNTVPDNIVFPGAEAFGEGWGPSGNLLAPPSTMSAGAAGVNDSGPKRAQLKRAQWFRETARQAFPGGDQGNRLRLAVALTLADVHDGPYGPHAMDASKLGMILTCEHGMNMRQMCMAGIELGPCFARLPCPDIPSQAFVKLLGVHLKEAATAAGPATTAAPPPAAPPTNAVTETPKQAMYAQKLRHAAQRAFPGQDPLARVQRAAAMILAEVHSGPDGPHAMRNTQLGGCLSQMGLSLRSLGLKSQQYGPCFARYPSPLYVSDVVVKLMVKQLMEAAGGAGGDGDRGWNQVVAGASGDDGGGVDAAWDGEVDSEGRAGGRGHGWTVAELQAAAAAVYKGNSGQQVLRWVAASALAAVGGSSRPCGPYSMRGSEVGQVMAHEAPEAWGAQGRQGGSKMMGAFGESDGILFVKNFKDGNTGGNYALWLDPAALMAAAVKAGYRPSGGGSARQGISPAVLAACVGEFWPRSLPLLAAALSVFAQTPHHERLNGPNRALLSFVLGQMVRVCAQVQQPLEGKDFEECQLAAHQLLQQEPLFAILKQEEKVELHVPRLCMRAAAEVERCMAAGSGWPRDATALPLSALHPSSQAALRLVLKSLEEPKHLARCLEQLKAIAADGGGGSGGGGGGGGNGVAYDALHTALAAACVAMWGGSGAAGLRLLAAALCVLTQPSHVVQALGPHRGRTLFVCEQMQGFSEAWRKAGLGAIKHTLQQQETLLAGCPFFKVDKAGGYVQLLVPQLSKAVVEGVGREPLTGALGGHALGAALSAPDSTMPVPPTAVTWPIVVDGAVARLLPPRQQQLLGTLAECITADPHCHHTWLQALAKEAGVACPLPDTPSPPPSTQPPASVGAAWDTAAEVGDGPPATEGGGGGLGGPPKEGSSTDSSSSSSSSSGGGDGDSRNDHGDGAVAIDAPAATDTTHDGPSYGDGGGVGGEEGMDELLALLVGAE